MLKTSRFMERSQEQAIINGLTCGDKNAMSQLVEVYNHRLYIYALSLQKDQMLAEDIVQNVFIKVWEKRSTLTSETKLNAYLYRSVYNEVIDNYRRTQVKSRIEQEYLTVLENIDSGDNDDDDFEDLLTLVNKAINNLPPKCKQIFELSKREGLTNREIATHLEVSIKTVEKQISNAYKSIKKYAGEHMDLVLLLLLEKKVQRVSMA